MQRMKIIAGVLGAIAISLSSGAFAQSTSGLGQSWPNRPDVSASSQFHAYTFTLNGIHYIQVNDLNGNVIGAVGRVGGELIVLPIGNASLQVKTTSQPASSSAVASISSASTSSTTVYTDASTTVTASTLSNGTVQISAEAPCDGNPVDCATRGP